MKIFVQGLWHCGIVTSACLSFLNHKVFAYDKDKRIINKLKKGNTPIYEPRLRELIKLNVKKKKLFFLGNKKKVNLADIVWFAYDTPVNDNDKADVEFVINQIKITLKKLKSNKNIVISSQLPVGTIKHLEIYSKNILKKKFNFFCCPENLRLGNALNSFLKAERLVIGFRNKKAQKKLKDFFLTINKNLIWMKVESAEVTKHAINSFLASSISFINEISTICENVGANAKEVEKGMKSEIRIGKKAFLSPGNPFSGGTLGRDVNFLAGVSKKFNLNTSLISSIRVSNDNHKKWIYNHLEKLIMNKKIKNITIWGLAYKENTDTLRRSLALEISVWLKKHKVKVQGYDSNIKKFSSKLSKILNRLSSPMSKIRKTDVLIILKNSPEFSNIKLNHLKKINKKLIIIDPGNVCSHFGKFFKKNYITVGSSQPLKIKKKMDFEYNFKNQVALITGASKGLGFEVAKSFLKYGSNLMICSRNQKQIKKTFQILNRIKSKKQKIFYLATDVSSPKEVRNLVEFTIKKLKKIDILVNNAGIYGPKGFIEKINWNDWTKAIEINLFGSVLLTRALMPHFKKKNKGKIIQMSGGGAASPLPMISGYAVSKAAVVRFVENLSEEVKKYNIDINAVAPGPLNTGMLDEVLKAGPSKVGKEFYDKSLNFKNYGTTPLKKVAELILFLASGYSDGIRGKLISVLWDNWMNWTNYKKLLSNSDAYTLRRVKGSERGFEWGDK